MKKYSIENYDKYVQTIIDLSNKQGKPLVYRDLKKYNLPYGGWFIDHCPNNSVNTWNDFVEWCGLVSNKYNKIDKINKNTVIKKLKDLEEQLGRPLQQNDINTNTIGVSRYTISKFWGDLSTCKEEIELRKCVKHPNKPWSYYNRQMQIALKNIYSKTNCKSFSWKDFTLYKNITLSKEGFLNCCKRENINPYDYFNNLGYKLISRNGSGRKYRYNDGELCVSNLEHIFSEFLRSEKISYVRNVRYSTFDKNFVGTKFDCDYVINNKYWIEICGMIKANSDNWKNFQGKNKLENDYFSKLISKEKSLIDNNISYLFLFAEDFNNDKYKEKLLDLMQQMSDR